MVAVKGSDNLIPVNFRETKNMLGEIASNYKNQHLLDDFSDGKDLIKEFSLYKNGNIPEELALRLKRYFADTVNQSRGWDLTHPLRGKTDAYRNMSLELGTAIKSGNEKAKELLGIEEMLMKGFGSLKKSLGKELTIKTNGSVYDIPSIAISAATGRPEIYALAEGAKALAKQTKKVGYLTKVGGILGNLSKIADPNSTLSKNSRAAIITAINDALK